MPRTHLDEKQHTLVFVLRPALAHTYRVVDACGKQGAVEHTVDLTQGEAHTRGVQHAVAGIYKREHLGTRKEKGREEGADLGPRICYPFVCGFMAMKSLWRHTPRYVSYIFEVQELPVSACG